MRGQKKPGSSEKSWPINGSAHTRDARAHTPRPGASNGPKHHQQSISSAKQDACTKYGAPVISLIRAYVLPLKILRIASFEDPTLPMEQTPSLPAPQCASPPPNNEGALRCDSRPLSALARLPEPANKLSHRPGFELGGVATGTGTCSPPPTDTLPRRQRRRNRCRDAAQNCRSAVCYFKAPCG